MANLGGLIRDSIDRLPPDAALRACSVHDVNSDNVVIKCGKLVIKVNRDPRVNVVSSAFMLSAVHSDLVEEYSTDIILRFFGHSNRRDEFDEFSIDFEVDGISLALSYMRTCDLTGMMYLHHYVLGYSAGYTDTLNRDVMGHHSAQ